MSSLAQPLAVPFSATPNPDQSKVMSGEGSGLNPSATTQQGIKTNIPPKEPFLQMDNPLTVPKAEAQSPAPIQPPQQTQPGDYAIHPGQDQKFTQLIESGRQSNQPNQVMLDTIMAGNPNVSFVNFAKHQMATLQGSPEEKAKQVLNFFAYGDPNHPDPPQSPPGFADHITPETMGFAQKHPMLSGIASGVGGLMQGASDLVGNALGAEDATKNVQNIGQAAQDFSSGKQGFTDTAMQMGGNAVSGVLQPVTHAIGMALTPFSAISNTMMDAADSTGKALAGTSAGKAVASTVAPTADSIMQHMGPLVSMIQQHANDPSEKSLKAVGQAVMDTIQAYGAGTEGVKAVSDIKKVPSATEDLLIDRKTPEQLKTEIQGTVGKIIQAKDSASLKQATKSLDVIDTKGVKTYNDLNTVINNKLNALKSAQDDILSKVKGENNLESFGKTAEGKSGAKMSINSVKTALSDLENLYSSIGEPENYVRIKDLGAKAANEGLTATEINNIAREYGTEFKRKAFNKMGDPLTSVSAQSYENTRMGVKNSARSLMPDKASTIIDGQIHSLIDTQSNIQKMMESVQSAANKQEHVGLLRRAGSLIFKGINAATFDGLTGFLREMFPPGIGAGTMTPTEIEDTLSKNLERFNKLSKALPEMSDPEAATAINKFVTEEQTGPSIQNAQQTTQAPSSPSKSKRSKSSPSTIPPTGQGSQVPKETYNLTPEERATGLIGGGGDGAPRKLPPHLQSIVDRSSIQDVTPQDVAPVESVKTVSTPIERLKGETLDQAVARKVGYQIDNGVVSLTEGPDGWQAKVQNIGDGKPMTFGGYKKQDVINQVYKYLNPDHGVSVPATPTKGIPKELKPLAIEAKRMAIDGKTAEDFAENLRHALPEGPAETRRIRFINQLEKISKPKDGWYDTAIDFFKQAKQALHDENLPF